MSIVQDDVVRVTAKMTDANGSLIMNVFYWIGANTTPVTESAFLTAVEAHISAMYEAMDTYLPNTLTPYEIEADIMHFVSGKLVTKAPVGTIAWTTWAGGEGSTDGLPQQDSALVNFPTLIPGVVGRKYIGPLVEAAQNAGVAVGGLLAELATFGGLYLGALTVSGETFWSGVMSTKTAGFVGFVTDVVRSVIATQRRRKVGRGV